MRKLLEMHFIKRMPAMLVIILILVTSLVVGYLWVGVALPAVAAVKLISPETWSLLEGLTSAATFALAIGTGVIVIIELTERSDSRNLDIYRDIYEKFMSREEVCARRYIYQNLPQSEDKKALVNAVLKSPQTRDYVKQVLNTLDYFGFLIDQDWVTADEVIGWLSPVVVKVWVKIGPVVEYECAMRPEEPDYYLNARNLVLRCTKWRNNHIPVRRQDINFDRERL